MERRVVRHLEVFPDPAAAASALAQYISECAVACVRSGGRFRWVLAGGHTPAPLYRELAGAAEFPWADTEVFFGDERAVGPESPESNYGMARTAFLSAVPIPEGRVHRIPGEVRPPSEAAARYAAVLGPLPGADDPPRFDLVLLGLGPDGHTASLFPGDPATSDGVDPVVAVASPPVAPFVPRITLSAPALSSSAEVCFLVTGNEKAAPLAATFRAPDPPDRRYPATLVRPRSPVRWYVDRAAASSLR